MSGTTDKTVRRMLGHWPVYTPHVVAVVFMVNCAAIAMWGQTGLRPMPVLEASDYPHTLDANRLVSAITTRNPYITHTQGLQLFENTQFSFSFEAPRTGRIPIYVIARGTPANQIYPCMHVKVDGRLTSTFFCPSDDWGLYHAYADMTKGRHHLEIAYVNDGLFYPADRNIEVLRITMGAPPADAATYYRWRAPVAIPPERMSLRICGENSPRGYRLWRSGLIGDDVFFDQARVYTVHVSASRWASSGPVSHIDVQRDDETIVTLAVDSAAWTSFEVPCLIRTAGLHRITLVNRTKWSATPEDDDVLIENVRIGPQARPPSAPEPVTVCRRPVTIPAARFDFHSTGEELDGEWALWSNGYMQTRLLYERSGIVTVTVRARGQICLDRGPRLTAVMDSDQLAVFHVESRQHADYSFRTTLRRGPHTFMIIFDNDAMGPGSEDRNLFVRDVMFTAAEE